MLESGNTVSYTLPKLHLAVVTHPSTSHIPGTYMCHLPLFGTWVQFWSFITLSHPIPSIACPVRWEQPMNETFALESFQSPICVQFINQHDVYRSHMWSSHIDKSSDSYEKFMLLSRNRKALGSLQGVFCHPSPLSALSLTVSNFLCSSKHASLFVLETSEDPCPI